ncbi:MAG: PucR family transcriptional regulator [Nocardioides sp.]
MSTQPMAAPSNNNGPESLRLEPALANLLGEQLREVAGHTITAIMAEVPAYAGALSGRMGANIETAVQMALGGFLRLATRGPRDDPGTPQSPALEGAYELGRGEARNGRSADALLAAYRVGARVAWRELSTTAVREQVPTQTLAAFAELVFAYIDELSAASVAGHTDEMASSGRLREQEMQRLALALVRGAPADVLMSAAERAEWAPPTTLTAVILPKAQVRSVLAAADPRTLAPIDDLGTLDDGLGVLLVANAHDRSRGSLLRSLADRSAVVGPARPWRDAHLSYERALRALPLRHGSSPVDTDRHLVELVLSADPGALADLRSQALAPIAALKPAAADKLTDTLRAWLLHHGRRDEIAAAVFVHPQTVRYRMAQLRSLYGESLSDPRTVLELTVALGIS